MNTSRLFYPVLAVIAALATAGAFWGAYEYFKTEELAKAEARLSLYQSTVDAELKRFSHLTFVLARDPFVINTAKGAATKELNERLSQFAESAGIDAIYLMDRTGETRSASNAGTQSSFVGQNYAFRPYFQTALKGQQGSFYGIGATTGIPGYFFAEAVRSETSDILGVIAIKIDLSALQTSWQNAGERVILANADGISLLSSVPDWRYRALRALSEDQKARIAQARQFGNQTLQTLDWAPLERQRAMITGQRLLYLKAQDLPNNWSLHYFATDNPAVTRAWLVTGGLLAVAGVLFMMYQVQRTRRIGEALARSEQEEADLRTANARLAVEIEERRTAETSLQRTQAELERAGRLAALGQLASSVTHELGQPIAAMRNHLAAAELQDGPTSLGGKLQGLVDRMDGITRQLKFFSRKGQDNLEAVDLRDAMRSALDLVAPNVEVTGVDLAYSAPECPVVLKANRLRIEQVMTNLLRNALDATDGHDAPRLEIEVGCDDTAVWFQVADNGHGLGDKTLDELQEPFTTTRESGQGMGLGLTISAGIVTDHDGTMRAKNRVGGGAMFKARFPIAEVEGAP